MSYPPFTDNPFMNGGEGMHFGCVCSGEEQQPPAPTFKPTVLPLGDRVMAQAKNDPITLPGVRYFDMPGLQEDAGGYSFENQIKQDLNCTVISGYLSEELRMSEVDKNFAKYVPGHTTVPINLLILCFGREECKLDPFTGEPRLSVDRFGETYRSIVDKIRNAQPNCTIVILTPPPVYPEVQRSYFTCFGITGGGDEIAKGYQSDLDKYAEKCLEVGQECNVPAINVKQLFEKADKALPKSSNSLNNSTNNTMNGVSLSRAAYRTIFAELSGLVGYQLANCKPTERSGPNALSDQDIVTLYRNSRYGW